MKKLARWLRENGLSLLSEGAAAYVSGGKTLIPKIIKKITKTIGLPETANETEILAHLTGNSDALVRLREIEQTVDLAEIHADTEKYNAQLSYEMERIKQVEETARARLVSDDSYVRRARPTGLYLVFNLIKAFGVLLSITALWSYWQSSQMVFLCEGQGNVAACLAAVDQVKLPLEMLGDFIKAVPMWVWLAMLAPMPAYYPLRSLDKVIKSVVISKTGGNMSPVIDTDTRM